MIPLYILAGGRSTRFGSDKARIELDGVTLLMRVAAGLAEVTASATVVASHAGAYADLGLRTIGDIEPGQGPLGGLVTALRDAEGSAIFLAACDLRDPRADWARQLMDTSATSAFRTDRGWEPLFARYQPEALGAAERLLAEGERSMQSLLDEVGTAIPAPPGWPAEPSFNSPGQLG